MVLDSNRMDSFLSELYAISEKLQKLLHEYNRMVVEAGGLVDLYKAVPDAAQQVQIAKSMFKAAKKIDQDYARLARPAYTLMLQIHAALLWDQGVEL